MPVLILDASIDIPRLPKPKTAEDRKAALVERISLHLQGEHEQQTHAPGVGPSGYQALAPAKRFNKQLRQKTLDQLESTEEGKHLSSAITSFQSQGGGVKSLRSNITKELNNPGSGGQEAQAMLKALRNHPTTEEILYRGMRVATSHKTLVEQSPPGSTIDLNISSFSTNYGTAKLFSEGGTGKGNTEVIIGVVGRKRGLPIQNLANDRSTYNEKEVVTGGRFKVLGIDRQQGKTIISVQQVDTL